MLCVASATRMSYAPGRLCEDACATDLHPQFARVRVVFWNRLGTQSGGVLPWGARTPCEREAYT
eukprot:12772569-Alexandrium_andersonii.AAC.1